MDRFRPALGTSPWSSSSSAEWPERERFRRRLVQRRLDQLSLDQLLRDMPSSNWHSRQVPPDRVVLSLQVLQGMPQAAHLLDVCVAIIQRAYALYVSEEEDDPVLRSDDPLFTAASQGDSPAPALRTEVADPSPAGPARRRDIRNRFG